MLEVVRRLVPQFQTLKIGTIIANMKTISEGGRQLWNERDTFTLNVVEIDNTYLILQLKRDVHCEANCQKCREKNNFV